MVGHINRRCQLVFLTTMLWAASLKSCQSIGAPVHWDDELELSDRKLFHGRRALLDNGEPVQSNSTSEAEILLGFRDAVTSDRNGALVSWNTTLNSNHCTWHGITCDLSGHVSALNLPSQQLVGAISPLLGHLTFLSSLDLADNSFNGSIPSSLGLLGHLQYLDISMNMLQHSIPAAISNCSSLTQLKLSSNMLAGTIPSELGRLRSLNVLILNSNNLTGSIPKSITNCTSLTELDLGNNSLNGPILPELGLLGNLTFLFLDGNYGLNGSIPSSLGNLSSLKTLWLGKSQLTGHIPPELGRLHNLENIRIMVTYIAGNIPPEFGSMSSLKYLWLASNGNLTGTIPPALGNLTKLLTFFVPYNNLFGEIPQWIGGLPAIGNLDLRYNQLTGNIPTGITNLTNIWRLLLSYNHLSGPLIPELGQLETVQELGLDFNNFTGEIPSTLANCQKLNLLFLNGNNLTGSIPVGLINSFRDIIDVRLDVNQLSGSIPEFGQLTGLSTVNFSFNNFSGPIPPSIQNSKALIFVDFSNNHLTGELPIAALQKLLYLQNFTVANNSLQGPIPASVAAFVNVTAADYAGNVGLCGALLGRDCPIPSSVPPPKKACQGMHCHHLWIYVASVVAVGSLLAAITTLALIFVLKKSAKEGYGDERDIPDINLFTKELPWLTLTTDDLTAATEGFSERNIVGVGGNSTVYKAIIPDHDGMVIAMKCLNLNPDDETTTVTLDLYHELKVLGNLRHRNLVKLYGYCSSVTPPLKALLMEFVPNGSLHRHLHRGKQGCHLSLETRLEIAIGVVDAMVYLHHECHEPIIHRDLKPNNILLDLDFNAKVADFGIAKYIHGDNGEATASTFYGTIGYIAPEYATSNRVSTKGDVYSYGVVLLEMLTGKRPTDGTFANDGTWLGDWVLEAFPDGIANILDHTLNSAFAARREQILMLIQVGILCTRDAAKDRPSMKDVRQMLLQVRDPSMTMTVMARYPTLIELASR